MAAPTRSGGAADLSDGSSTARCHIGDTAPSAHRGLTTASGIGGVRSYGEDDVKVVGCR